MMVWAVLQLAVPTIAVVADSAATTVSAGAHAHVESRSDASCVRVHDAECVFCQFLATGAAPAGSPTGAAVAAVVRQTISFYAATPDAGETLGARLARAPPLA